MSIHDTPLLLGASPGEALVHCVFIHGRTQSPEDMQEQVIAKLRMPGVCFVLPRARGNSWYDARATDVLTDRTRQQLDQAIGHVRQLIGALPGMDDHARPLVIGGFSQGACLAVEYAMRHGPWNGALASLTGCRVGTPDCDRPFVAAFADTAAALARARARLHCDILPDRSHEVSATEIAQLDKVLCGLSNRSWW